MHVSRKADYAVRALGFLASAEPGRLVLIQDVATAMAIPKPFLSKIMKDLVDHGLVTSQPGPGGGYALSRAPGQITFRQILEAVEGPVSIVPCQNDEEGEPCAMADQCAQADIWSRIRARMLTVFDEYTLDGVRTRGMVDRLPVLTR